MSTEWETGRDWLHDAGLAADGSAEADAHPTVEIDARSAPDRWRYTCPEGHVDWDKTNNHIWCRTCRRQNEHGRDVDPEHYFLVDQRTGESVPWAAVELVGE